MNASAQTLVDVLIEQRNNALNAAAQAEAALRVALEEIKKLSAQVPTDVQPEKEEGK